MEARELAELLKGRVETYARRHDDDISAELLDAETYWGYGESDFFIKTDDEGTFLVTVAKVA